MFDLRADFVHGYSYGSGHINDTYCVWVDQAGLRVRYILQRLAQNVFKQPIPLMNNVKRVTDHALARLLEEGCPEAHRRTLTLIPGKDGKPYVQDAEGNVWRVYPFIERARTYDTIETTKQCIEAARAFGNFQKLTADLPGEPLFETIPDFHNTTSRMNALKAAIKADPLGRVKEVQKEIDWYLSRDEDCHIVVNYLASGELPLRCTHNDTKLNNVMLDDVTGEGICVIDLDTTMPGSAIYDFGDMVRTATSPAAEDEKDTSSSPAACSCSKPSSKATSTRPSPSSHRWKRASFRSPASSSRWNAASASSRTTSPATCTSRSSAPSTTSTAAAPRWRSSNPSKNRWTPCSASSTPNNTNRAPEGNSGRSLHLLIS